MTTLDELFKSEEDIAIDPVCKMTVKTADPPGGTAEHAGHTYYFCGTGCQDAFVGNPNRFL